MVSKMPKPVKQLGELLQEQQEPFSLQVYLMERSYLISNQNEEDNRSCINSADRNSRMTVLMKKNRSSFPHCSKVLRAVCNKLVFTNQIQRRMTNKGFDCKDQKTFEAKKKRKKVAELDRMSIASGITLSNSFSDTDIEEISTSLCRKRNNVVSTSHQVRLREIEDGHKMREESSKQLSPVSVLVEELPLDEDQLESQARQSPSFVSIPTSNLENTPKEPNSSSKYTSKTRQEENTSTSYNSISRRRITEESILSASLWDLLTRSTIRMKCKSIAEVPESGPYNDYLNSKRVLQQRKQLLFDCVREAIETHEMKQRMQGRLPTFLSPEELGKLIYKKITAWGKESIDETSIRRLLNLDLLDSAEEWSELGTSVGEVAKEIEDAIFGDLLDEILG